MSRHWFGGGLADWAFTPLDGVDGHDNIVQLADGAEITFWNAAQAGTQLTDLLVEGQPAASVVTSEDGAIPVFQGPDGVWWMWADGGAGRHVIVAWDIGDFVAQVIGEAAANAASIQGHVAAPDAHSTRVRDLQDVNTAAAAAATDGQVLGFHAPSGLWLPINVEGVTGIVTVDTEQTITAHKTFQPASPGNRAVTFAAAAGQTADLWRALDAAGLEIARVDAQGNLRVQAAVGQVGLRVRRRAGQTARLLELVDAGENLLAWVELDGRVRGPNQGFLLPYSRAGELEVTVGEHRIYNDTGSSLTIRNVRASVGTPPEGDDIVVDVLLNGSSSIFAQAEDQPTIAAGTNTSGRVDSIGTAVLNDGAYLTVDIEQVGYTEPGADLTVQILCY